MEVMLSALQHYAFCPRQCALIHLEQVWQENEHTAEGRLMHENVHGQSSRMRDGIKIVTDLELHSVQWELHGRADVVEFHRVGAAWMPYPVEYKKGRPHKGSQADEVQLCGQALCLEEMLEVSIPEGALFYGQTHRRHTVAFDGALRERTISVIGAVKAMLESGRTPPAKVMAWCETCSLSTWCMPELWERSASRYVRALCREEV